MPNSMRYQPQGLIRLSKTGICNGIVDAWVGSNALNLLSNNSWQSFTPTSAPPYATSLWGEGLSFDGSAQYCVKTTSAITNTTDATILVLAIPSNTSATTRSIFGYGSTSSANQLLFIGQGASAGQLSFFARSDANTSQNLQVAGGSGWSNGIPAVVLGTRSESKNVHALYINGVSLSSTTATALGTSTFNRTTLGGLVRTSAGLLYNGGVYLAVSWNRMLSTEEIREVSYNPWMLFEAPDEWEEPVSGDTIISSDGSSSGVGTASASAVAIWGVFGTSAGVASANSEALSVFQAAGSGVGTANVDATSGATAGVVGSASGASSASAVANAISEAFGSSQGASSVDSVTQSIAGVIGSSVGSCNADALTQQIWAIVAQASGTSTANATTGGFVSAEGSSSGVSTVEAVANAIAAATGSVAGVASVSATSNTIFAADGSALGSATSAAVCLQICTTSGNASGVATVDAVTQAIKGAAGSSVGTSTVGATSSGGVTFIEAGDKLSVLLITETYITQLIDTISITLY